MQSCLSSSSECLLDVTDWSKGLPNSVKCRKMTFTVHWGICTQKLKVYLHSVVFIIIDDIANMGLVSQKQSATASVVAKRVSTSCIWRALFDIWALGFPCFLTQTIFLQTLRSPAITFHQPPPIWLSFSLRYLVAEKYNSANAQNTEPYFTMLMHPQCTAWFMHSQFQG